MSNTTILPGQNPGAYVSRWQEKLTAAAQAILDRPDFTYDPSLDTLYNAYRDRYLGQGRQAMLDTLGQAASLTGGYGNSYAQTAAQQTYGSYIQSLNDLLPQLYRQALDGYIARGEALQQRYDTLSGEEARDYGIYRDQVSDWQFQQKFDEDKRRYDQEWEYKTTRRGGGGGRKKAEESQTAVSTGSLGPYRNVYHTANYLK